MKASEVDYPKWLRKKLWQLHEGVSLILGVAPVPITKAQYDHGVKFIEFITSKIEDASLRARWLELHDHSKDAMTAREFVWHNPREIPWIGARLVDSLGYMRWAKSFGEPLPQEIKDHIAEIDGTGKRQGEKKKPGPKPKVAALEAAAEVAARHFYSRLSNLIHWTPVRVVEHLDFVREVFPDKPRGGRHMSDEQYRKHYGVNKRAMRDAVSKVWNELKQVR